MSHDVNRHMLIIRGCASAEEVAASEYKEAIQNYFTRIERMRQEGHFEASEPLGEKGSILTRNRVDVIDPPFSESKEAVGGLLHHQSGQP